MANILFIFNRLLQKFINNKKVINYLSIITGIIIISFAAVLWQTNQKQIFPI